MQVTRKRSHTQTRSSTSHHSSQDNRPSQVLSQVRLPTTTQGDGPRYGRQRNTELWQRLKALPSSYPQNKSRHEGKKEKQRLHPYGCALRKELHSRQQFAMGAHRSTKTQRHFTVAEPGLSASTPSWPQYKVYDGGRAQATASQTNLDHTDHTPQGGRRLRPAKRIFGALSLGTRPLAAHTHSL